jgi:hypothetical protein
VNAAGVGAASSASASVAPYNVASGGIETTVSNYNGTGQTWKTHVFIASGTFTVTKATQSFSTLRVGAGGGCGSMGDGGGGGPGGGGGGGVIENTAHVLSVGAHTIVVGNPGAGGGGVGVQGVGGGSGEGSTIDGSGPSGGGGSGGVWSWDSTTGAGSGAPQSNPGAVRVGDGGSGYGGGAGGVTRTPAGYASTITGASYTYGIGGVNGAANNRYGEGAASNSGWNSGVKGIVIVAYRIG